MGRTEAATGTGYYSAPTICSAANSSDVAGCSDSGKDYTFRIFMRAGEQINVHGTTLTGCSPSPSWYGTFKILSSLGCADTSCPTLSYCGQGTMDVTKNFTATQDGWYFVVADGYSSTDAGVYHLYVKLTCNVAGCECT